MAKFVKAEKRTFEWDGVKYAVRRPNMGELVKANEMRRKTFNEELEAGSLLRDQLESELRKRKMWSDDREAKYQKLRVEVIDKEFRLAKGGIKLSAARTIALDMREKRGEMVELLSSRTELDANSCEGKADAIRFNFLFASCLVYDETGEPYFPGGLNDYLLDQDNIVASLGATEFFYLISETEEVDAKLPENQFLKKFKFVNSEFQLVDKAGRLTDLKGRHIDPQGNFISWTEGENFVYVDADGRELNAEGSFDIEHAAFLDEDGAPIDECSYDETKKAEASKEETPKKPRKKRTSKKPVETTVEDPVAT